MQSIARWIRIGIIVAVVIGMSSSVVQAQTSRIDSLKLRLRSGLTDTSRVLILTDLCQAYHIPDKDQSVHYGLEAIALAQNIGYRRGEAIAEISLGTTYYYSIQKDSALYHLQKGVAIARAHSFKPELSSAYMNMGMLYYYFNEMDTALNLVQKSMAIEEEMGKKENLVKRYNNLAAIHNFLMNYKESIRYFFKALVLSRELRDTVMTQMLLNNIGRTYFGLNDYDKALDYFTQSLDFVDSTHNLDNWIMLNANICDVLLQQKRPAEALTLLNKILAVKKQENSCTRDFANISKAEAYLQLNSMDSVLQYGHRGLRAAEECQHMERQTSAHLVLGKAYLDLKNYNEAEKHLLAALEIKQIFDEINAECYRVLSLVYEGQGQFKKSLATYKIFKAKQDSIDQEKNTLDIARAEMNHELVSQKALLEARQENERLQFNQKITEGERIRNYLLIFFLALLVLSYILYQSYRRKRVANKVLAEKNRIITNQQQELMAKAELLRSGNKQIQELSEFKERLAHMVVHDMKNPLHTVIGLSTQEPTPKRMKRIRKSSIQMLNFVTNMLDIYKLEQANITLDLKVYSILQLVENAEQEVAVWLEEKDIELVKKIDPELRGAFDGVILIRILVNLLTNAIKYSDLDSKIIVEAAVERHDLLNRELILTITDEGTGIAPEVLDKIFEGFDPKKPHHITKSASTGIGLNFCKLAVKAHKGTISAVSEPGRGTCISLRLPLHLSAEPEHHISPGEIPLPREELILKPEREVVRSFAGRLQALQVHEVSKISAILQEADRIKIQSRWKEKVQSAVYAGHQPTYTQLIHLALGHA